MKVLIGYLLRQLNPDKGRALYELGIYGANYRIAVLMTIFVQMFRYAAEPFFFNCTGQKESTRGVCKYPEIFYHFFNDHIYRCGIMY